MSKESFSLDVIDVANPCSVPWDSMKGDELSRFCPQCQQRVYALSSMPLEEAAALVQRAEGRLCVRFYRRADRTVITKDCRGGLQAIRKFAAIAATVVLGVIFILFGLVGLRTASSGGPGSLGPSGGVEPFASILRWLDRLMEPPLQGAICIPGGTDEQETSQPGPGVQNPGGPDYCP
jgi:hypothetical protein